MDFSEERWIQMKCREVDEEIRRNIQRGEELTRKIIRNEEKSREINSRRQQGERVKESQDKTDEQKIHFISKRNVEREESRTQYESRNSRVIADKEERTQFRSRIHNLETEAGRQERSGKILIKTLHAYIHT
uniref:Uncharacterized protein n=1 Tax=Cacopsylla melanoneura TaxID=428564 RepID=A0A8D9BX67_9HEMI